jgi:hypothetical protein
MRVFKMKKMQKAMREFDRLKKQLRKNREEAVSGAKDSGCGAMKQASGKKRRELRELRTSI